MIKKSNGVCLSEKMNIGFDNFGTLEILFNLAPSFNDLAYFPWLGLHFYFSFYSNVTNIPENKINNEKAATEGY